MHEETTGLTLAQRELLEALDQALARAASRAGRESPAGDSVSLAALGDAAALPALADELAARGFLRAGAEPGTYALTEDGRLALARPLDVTLYTRPGCHLCDEAKAQIAPLLRASGARLREVNIDADPFLRGRYDFDVPVIFLGVRKVAKHRVDLRQFQRQLAEAARGSGKS